MIHLLFMGWFLLPRPLKLKTLTNEHEGLSRSTVRFGESRAFSKQEAGMFLISWKTKQELNASEYWDYIQQVARKRRPQRCPCCSVSSGYVSRHLFANVSALTTS